MSDEHSELPTLQHLDDLAQLVDERGQSLYIRWSPSSGVVPVSRSCSA